MVCTIVTLPGIGITGYAAVTDVASLINSSANPKGMWKSGNCTLTGNGTSSVTATGTSTGSMTAYPAFSFDAKTIGSGTDTILHLSYTISNPNGHRIDLRYQDSKGKYDLLKDFSAFIDPTSYQVDWFLNLIDRSYRLYFDNKLHTEGSIQSGATTIKNLYLDMPVSGEFTFTINDPKQEIYGAGATMNDVVAHTFKSRSNSNYYWTVNGIGNIGGADGSRIIGNIDWVNSSQPSYDGSNLIVSTHATNADSGLGYKLRILSANGTNKTKGCLPMDRENDNIIHQSLSITPNLSAGNYAAIGFRGNQAQLLNKYKFGPSNGFVNNQSYHFDIIVNNKDKKFWILVNGEKRATGGVGNDYLAAINYTINAAGSDTLAISNVVTTSYDYTVSMDDILDTLVTSSNYNWSFDGVDFTNSSIASGYSTPSNYVSVSGTNAGGYTLSATNDGARFGYRLGNGDKVALARDTTQDNIVHQHLSFTPTFEPGNTEQIGIRGNDGYHDLLTVSAEKGFISGNEYDMHIIINNKNFSYYFIVDGAIKGSGTIAAARSPLWEISYKINSNGDSMLLKNINTKYYKSSVTVYSLTDAYLTEIYSGIQSISVSEDELTANTLFVGPTEGFTSAEKVVYALYNADGSLAEFALEGSLLSLINSENEKSFDVPESAQPGDVLTVKAFVLDMGLMKPVSECAAKTYTVE